MFFFEGSSCPVCGKAFEAGDDVVACPVCGAPHHRACYKEKNACAFEERHAEGFVWERGEAETPGGESGAEDEPVRCSACGMLNRPGRLYCQGCSNPLYTDVAGTRSEPEDEERAKAGPQPAQSGFYGIGQEISPVPDGELLEGVPAGDIRRFLGFSSYMYLPIFLAFARKAKKVSFNLIAMLMHGMWFILKKMYVLGGCILAGMLGIYAYQASCYSTVMPYYEKMASGDTTAGLQLFTDHPLMFTALLVLTVVKYAVYILSGLFANRIYMTHCVKSIKKINSTSLNAEQFNRRLESEGGQSLIVGLAGIFIYFGAQMLIQMRFM